MRFSTVSLLSSSIVELEGCILRRNGVAEYLR